MRRKSLTIIVAIIFLVAVVNVFFGISRIESDSMWPTISNNDWVLFFRYSKPVRFGVFFVDDPKKETRQLVKRVTGLPGEKVYLDYGFYFIPIDHYFVLGDHKGKYWDKSLGERVVTFDSRSFGPVHSSSIHERVVFVFWPLKNARWLW